MGHGHGKHGHDKHGHHGKHAAGDGDARELHDGVGDGLVPLVPLDLATISSADDLVRAMSRTAFAGRSLGEAADVLEAMVRDPECMVVCTLSGAMTIAKMGLVLCDMIEQGWIHAIVSTGALMLTGGARLDYFGLAGTLQRSATVVRALSPRQTAF